MNKNQTRSQAKAILTVAILLVVALTLNVVVWLIPESRVQRDMTAEKFYTLSDEIGEFLSQIDEDITLYLIDANGGDEKFLHFIERMTDRSERITLKKLSLTEGEALVKDWGITAESLATMGYCLIAESDKRSEIVDYSSLFYYSVTNSTLNSMGLTKLSTSEYSYYASYFSQDQQYAQYLSYLVNESQLYFQGETVMAAMLEYVIADVIPVHYVVTGHGEQAFGASALEEIYAYHGTAYKTLDLRQVKQIPADASSLLIVSPEADYSEADVDMLRTYLKRGGQITVLTNEENLAMPNLMSLMASYGMSATAGAVLEKTVAESEGEEGETPVEPTEAVTLTINAQHESLAALDQLSSLPNPVVKGGNALTLDNTVESSLILTPLLTTSENAYIGTDDTQLGVRTLAAAAETADGAHLVWFTGAKSFLASAESITEEGDPRLSNDYCVYMSVQWTDLVYESQIQFPEDVLYNAGYLQAMESDATGFGALMILLIPAVLIVGGVIVQYRRRKRDE